MSLIELELCQSSGSGSELASAVLVRMKNVCQGDPRRGVKPLVC